MAKSLRQSSGLLLSLSLAALPWLGCSGSDSNTTGTGGGDAVTSGMAGAHAGGSAGAAGHGGGGPTSTAGTGGSIGPKPGSGTAGTTGSAGTTGTPPATGTAGTAATGAAGTMATPPATGAGGTSATPPTTGAAGGHVIGTTGSAGTTGAGSAGLPPTTGAAGTAGTPPATGSAGTTGTPPTTGAAGTAGTPPTTGTAGTTSTGGPPGAGNAIKNVFVIAMENEPAALIYGNKKAPYLNGLMSKYAYATAFTDTLADSVPSEPHYVWMEAGTNKFSDTTFTSDSDPSAGNSTKSTAHLTTQMMAANPPVTWMGAMEGLNSSTGACPVSSSGFYAAKHDPFIFFQDVSGSPPSKTNALCGAHHTAFTTGQALVQGTVAQYTFIAPNVCNDMHGDSACPAGDVIAMGDAWLAANVPALIDYVNAHSGVIFIVWDEPEGGSPVMPFVAIGPRVKPAYKSTATFTHSSMLKTVEEIFGLPILPALASSNDLADLFQAGTLP